MKISVVIPVYNEINTIRSIIERVNAVPLDKEIIVVDDCSTDGTRDELGRLEADIPVLKVIYKDANEGKGAAIHEAFRAVSGDIVIIQDADLEYYPEEYPRLIEPIVAGKADVVYGSRFLGSHRVFTFSHYLGNKLLNFMTNLLFNCIFTDMETCYKAFRADIIKRLKLRSKSFGFEPEFTANVVKRGYKIYEVPISYDGRSFTEGKKITWRDGIIALYWLLRCKVERMDAGKEALLRMESADRYSDWISRRLAPWLGDRILEAGAGVGAITKRLLNKSYLVASDPSRDCIESLGKRIVGSDRLRLEVCDPQRCEAKKFAADRLDTVLSVNLLQNLEDDDAALRCFHDTLAAGGRCVLLVPACRRLFSKMDSAMGHKRRYSKHDLGEKMKAAGFEIESIRYFNLLGALGWFVNGKIFRRGTLPRRQIGLFNLLVPLLKAERLIPLPFGLSLIAAGKKEGK